jgi:hypothetical protein
MLQQSQLIDPFTFALVADGLCQLKVDDGALAQDKSERTVDHDGFFSIALDRSSARTIDADGHMRVNGCILTKAVVNPYTSDELENVPGADRLDLGARKIFEVYRDPKELERGTPTLEGKPLLLEHKASTADDHPRRLTIGTITNPVYENGTIKGDLVIWDGEAIELINSGDQRSLSCGYRYECVPEDGVSPEGKPFQARMKNIQFNHVSLVSDPRVEGAMVADSAAELAWAALGEALDGLSFDVIVAALDADWKEGDHPRAENGQFGQGGGSPPPKRSAFYRVVENELHNVFSESGVDTWGQLRALATEGRNDAAEWKKANRRCDKLEMEAIDKVYGKNHHGPMSHKDYDHLLPAEFHALQERIGKISEKYGIENADDLALYAKEAPQALAKAEKLRARMQRSVKE